MGYWSHRSVETSSTRKTATSSASKSSTSCKDSTMSTHHHVTALHSEHGRPTSTILRGATITKPSRTTRSSPNPSLRTSTRSKMEVHSSPTPSATTPNPLSAQKGRRFHLTLADRKAVIACSVIGGMLVLALAGFLIWQRRRRQKHALYPYLAADEAQSTTTFLTTRTRDANLTALPIHRDRHRTASGNMINDSLSPARPVGPDLWKSVNPPTPTHSTFFPGTQPVAGPALLQPPEMAMVPTHPRHLNPAIRVSSHDGTFYTPAESIHAPSTIDFKAKSYERDSSGQSSSQLKRWSLSTSFATARSHLSSSAMARLPGVSGLRDWINGQSVQTRRFEEDQLGPKEFRGVLKNKATKPNLAPVPTREMLRRQHPLKRDLRSSSGQCVGNGTFIPDDGVMS